MKTLLIFLLFPLISFGQWKQLIPADTVNTLITDHKIHGINAYGTTAFNDSAVVLSVNQDAWTHITNATHTIFSLKTPNKNVTMTADTLFANVAGIYHVTGHVTFRGNNNEIWKVSIRSTKGDAISCAQMDITVIGADRRTLPVNGILDLDANEGIYLVIYNDTDGDDPTLNCGNITMSKVDYK